METPQRLHCTVLDAKKGNILRKTFSYNIVRSYKILGKSC